MVTGTRLKGLYCDGTIAIDKTMTEKEKACVLTEEMGHYYTTVGNIIDQSSASNRKQERRARIWAYNYMISLSKIIDAYNAGCQNQYEIAEYLDVTEHFLLDSLQYYKEKYGICAVCGNYLIYFEPAWTLRIPLYIKQLIDDVETDVLVPFSGDTLYRKWSTLIKKAGIPYMTFHDLRHVSASVMAVLQVPDKYAQDRGGWKTDNIMKSTYMQTFDPYRKQVDDQIDTYMEQMLFHQSSNLFEKKYNSYLILFDLKDTAANKRAFKKFCNEHSIKT